LLSGRRAHYQVRDWAGDEFGTSLGGWKTLDPAPVVVIEGVTCTRAAMAGRLAYGVWVEAPEAVRLRRGVARDGESHRHLWREWMAEERAFFAEDRTRERADLRVDGDPSTPHDPATQIVSLA
jgi:uridine kinase